MRSGEHITHGYQSAATLVDFWCAQQQQTHLIGEHVGRGQVAASNARIHRACYVIIGALSVPHQPGEVPIPEIVNTAAKVIPMHFLHRCGCGICGSENSSGTNE